MSSEKTPNLELHTWEASDYVQRTEFNDNFTKIDTHAKQVTKQLEDIVFVENFKNVSESEDSRMWQRAVNYAASKGISKVSCKSKQYLFHNIVEVPSFIKIDLNEANIDFENVNNIVINPQSNRQSWAGVFKVWGSEIPTTKTNLLGYKTAKALISDGVLSIPRNNNISGRWTVADASHFSKGDFVKIWVPYRGQDVNEYFPVTRVMARVEMVDYVNNFIYTDYYSPFDYSDYVFRSDTDYVMKVNPVRDVEIKNGTITDLKQEFNRSTDTDGPNRQYYPCGVGQYLAYNCNYSNLTFKNLKFSGITCYIATKFEIDNITVDTPFFVGPGEGYATQNACVFDFKIKRVKSIGAPRHLVDISTGGFGEVEGCKSFTNTNGGLDCHGAGEHDITFRDCVGSVLMGNNPAHFNDLGHNIKYDNCDLRLNRVGYYTNTVFSNCDVIVYTTSETYVPQIKFVDCRIGFVVNPPFTCNKRDRNIASWIKFINSEIYYAGEPFTSLQYISIFNYETAEMTGCTVHNMGGWHLIRFVSSQNVNLGRNTFKDTAVTAHVSSTTPIDGINYDIYRNNYIFTDEINGKWITGNSQLFPLNNFGGSKGFIKFDKNFYHSKRTVSTSPIHVLQIADNFSEGADIDIIFNENNFRSNTVTGLNFNGVSLTNLYLRYSARDNRQQGSNKVVENIGNTAYAMLEQEYDRGTPKNFVSVIFPSSNVEGYKSTKLATITMNYATHLHFIFDWIARHASLPANGKTSLSINFDVITGNPTVNLITDNYGVNANVDGSAFTLVDVSTSSTTRRFELYATYPTHTTFSYVIRFQSPNILINWDRTPNYISALPSGTKYNGINKV